ncbi:hypothetical protein V6N13_004237 [Hibiscus sabdariffa]
MQLSSMVVGSSSKPPPPPPSPPRASSWDFLNPFKSFESYYPSYTPSWDSREARPNVGIENEMVEYEVHVVDKKVVEKKPWRGRRNPSSSVGLGMVKATQNGW